MSTTSNTSLPISVETPRTLAPAASSLTSRPVQPMPVVLKTPSILTNKKWVVPPRPKPGRKPATDTPPTKRKAQNRAAQRAFRERRAAKVGELEEQMKQMEEEDQREQEELRDQIRRLETEVETYQQTLLSWQEEAQNIDQIKEELNHERKLRQEALRELSVLRRESTAAVPLPRRTKSNAAIQADHVIDGNLSTGEPFKEEVPLGCGNCTASSHCECIEQAFEMDNLELDASDCSSKRPHSPCEAKGNKRPRSDLISEVKFESEPTEIDFTTKLANPSLPHSTSSFSIRQTNPTTTPNERCGFCEDGTPCVCAEIVAEKSPHTDSRAACLISRLSKDDYNTRKEPSPTISRSKIPTSDDNPCRNGPGTCSQCLSDPMSTAFCKSLAATRSSDLKPKNPQDTSVSTMSCGKSGGCCRDAKNRSSFSPSPQDESGKQAITGPLLTCADTFTALSRHPAYDKASNHLESWLPQLATLPKGIEGRTAFEVEAASVMGVLRFFDTRFGRESPNEENGKA
ncbi:hypothetical protein MMC20_001231, partial [Loxospora ochrophaea]|nr:hypothetical protein [Loxospora ochrophaea]